MSNSLYKAFARSIQENPEVQSRTNHFESAIVADVNDPEKRHRIKVVIPSIDEDQVYDEWVSPATPFSSGDQFGSFFLPELGSEVFISGVRGQKYNFVYHGAVYNEDARVPDLGDDTQGIKAPKNLTFWATMLLLLQGENVRIVATQLARIAAENIEAAATSLLKLTGQNIQTTAEQENKIEGETITVNGTTININSDESGNITIHSSGNVNVTADGNATVSAIGVLKLGTRIVNKIGPNI